MIARPCPFSLLNLNRLYQPAPYKKTQILLRLPLFFLDSFSTRSLARSYFLLCLASFSFPCRHLLDTHLLAKALFPFAKRACRVGLIHNRRVKAYSAHLFSFSVHKCTSPAALLSPTTTTAAVWCCRLRPRLQARLATTAAAHHPSPLLLPYRPCASPIRRHPLSPAPLTATPPPSPLPAALLPPSPSTRTLRRLSRVLPRRATASFPACSTTTSAVQTPMTAWMTRLQTTRTSTSPFLTWTLKNRLPI
ncbi:hypothetical protein BX070DRAFT_99693 [Coemansia spiralis]|nr:hypothetical protein BX070DRAFT_99693 [Coemansia spiralis]